MAETVNMPKLGFDMAEGTLVRWVKTEGEQINKGDVLAEIETDKATVEVESSAAGVVLRHLVDQGTIVPVSTPIAVIGEEGEKVDELPAQVETAPEPDATAPVAPVAAFDQTQGKPGPAQPIFSATESRRKASPLARRMAKEKNVSLGNIQGTGPGGRIVRRDIEAALSVGALAPAASSAPAFAHPADEVISTSRLRQAIGRRMVEAKQQVPHFYVTYEYRMEALLEARKRINAALESSGEKLSVNDFLVKAAALTLREFPNLNASFHGDQVMRHGEINVGNAVAVENGLLTVVCRAADQKSLRQISADVKSMAARVREGKVKPDDIEGSTFSISNLGMYNVEHFIAIINPPEAAILAVGAARQVPVVENGELTAGWTMKATISVDHRVSDGAEAAKFMQALAKYIQEPVMLAV